MRLSIAVVLKVVDIDPQGSIRPSKGSINSQGVEWVSLNGPGVNEELLLTSIVLSIFSDCVLFYHTFQVKRLKFILKHTFLVSVTVGLGHGVYRKLYTLIGGQLAEKFENH